MQFNKYTGFTVWYSRDKAKWMDKMHVITNNFPCFIDFKLHALDCLLLSVIDWKYFVPACQSRLSVCYTSLIGDALWVIVCCGIMNYLVLVDPTSNCNLWFD